LAGGIEENRKRNLNDSQSLSQHLNLGHPEYEAEVLTTLPHSFVPVLRKERKKERKKYGKRKKSMNSELCPSLKSGILHIHTVLT
jgi:hypothetical protein